MKNFVHILVFIFFIPLTFAQSGKAIDSIRLDGNDIITDFGTDDFNSIYYIRNFAELNKIDYRTQKRESFSNQSILENLNTQNVLQISLKSGIFNLVVLDNQLNLVHDPIQFPIDGSFMPTLTSLVDNSYLWGYDPVLQRLVLWNYRDRKIIRQSVILNDKTGDNYFSDLIYTYNRMYLISQTKILQFDEYANLESVIPFQAYNQIIYKDNAFYFSTEDGMYQLNLKTKEKVKIPLDSDFDYFSINKNFLFVLKNKVVYIYNLPK